MRLADFFIGKPGPGSLSEALHVGCPVIIERNLSTMPQERPNVEWVLENGVGIAVKSLSRQIAKAVQHMEEHLDWYRNNIKMNLEKNSAIFEIVGFLERIADSHSTECISEQINTLPVDHFYRHG